MLSHEKAVGVWVDTVSVQLCIGWAARLSRANSFLGKFETPKRSTLFRGSLVANNQISICLLYTTISIIMTIVKLLSLLLSSSSLSSLFLLFLYLPFLKLLLGRHHIRIFCVQSILMDGYYIYIRFGLVDAYQFIKK